MPDYVITDHCSPAPVGLPREQLFPLPNRKLQLRPPWGYPYSVIPSSGCTIPNASQLSPHALANLSAMRQDVALAALRYNVRAYRSRLACCASVGSGAGSVREVG